MIKTTQHPSQLWPNLFKTNFSYPDSLSLRQHLGMAVASAWNRSFYQKYWNFSSQKEAVSAVYDGGFSSFPIIRKSHLRSNFDELIDYTDSVDLVSSSGTTGRPVDMPIHYEQEKGRILRVRRILKSLGVKQGSRVLLLLSLNDLFTLGVLTWQAIKEEGATAIRCSPSRLDRVLDAIKYNKPEFVIANPYVMVRLAKQAGDRWPEKEDLPSAAFFAVAATFNPDLSRTMVAEKAVELWGLKTYRNQYGTSEVGPVACQYSGEEGFTVHSDFHHLELVDSQTGEAVEEGKEGEVVITGLSYQRGFLPIRYSTGDMAAWLKKETDSSGKERLLMGPIIGRTDHQLKIYGQTVFPNLLLEIADAVSEIKRSVVTVVRSPLKGDIVSVLCALENGADESAIKNKIELGYRNKLAVSPEVKFVTQDHIQKLENKVSQKTNKSKIPRFFEIPSGLAQA